MQNSNQVFTIPNDINITSTSTVVAEGTSAIGATNSIGTITNGGVVTINGGQLTTSAVTNGGALNITKGQVITGNIDNTQGEINISGTGTLSICEPGTTNASVVFAGNSDTLTITDGTITCRNIINTLGEITISGGDLSTDINDTFVFREENINTNAPILFAYNNNTESVASSCSSTATTEVTDVTQSITVPTDLSNSVDLSNAAGNATSRNLCKI